MELSAVLYAKFIRDSSLPVMVKQVSDGLWLKWDLRENRNFISLSWEMIQ